MLRVERISTDYNRHAMGSISHSKQKRAEF